MILKALIIMAFLASYNPYQGWSSYYGKMPTDATIVWRIDNGYVTQADVEEADILLAVQDCSRVGEKGVALIRANGINEDTMEYYTALEEEVRYLIFDCSGHFKTTKWMAKEAIVAELDYYGTEKYAPCRCGTWLELRPLTQRVDKWHEDSMTS